MASAESKEMSTHLEASLQRDFERIRELVMRMGDLAVRALRDALGAFETGDRQRASLLIVRDQKIDLMQRQIDRLCLEFLVRHQPVGTQLRFVYATVLVNFELERVGDYAESLARQSLKLDELGYRAPSGLLEDIAPASIAMLQNAVTAFVRQDADLAHATAQIEEQIDQQRNQVNSELLHLVQTGQLPLAALTPLMTMARRFERVSDQAKSICQETIYICTGQYAMHSDSQVYRVLFVDQDQGPASRIAEAVGRSLKRTDFDFTSAGLEPRPITPTLDAYLREKGLPIVPAGARAVENMQNYHLVIILSPDLRKRLPAPSRKSALLDWTLPPGDAQSASPDSAAAYARLHDVLARRIFDVVWNLAGEEPSVKETSSTKINL